MSELLRLRVGDRLPQLACTLQDNLGVAVNLTGNRAFAVIRSMDDGTVFGYASPWVTEMTVANPATGLVVFDWLQTDVDKARPGWYAMSVRVTASNGTTPVLESPTERIANISVRSRGT